MSNKILPKVKEFFANAAEWFRIRVVRPFKKRQRRRAYLHRRELIHEATGELIEKFEPMLMKLMNETLSSYHESMPQNHYTVQATHDIRRLYEIKLKGFISSKK